MEEGSESVCEFPIPPSGVVNLFWSCNPEQVPSIYAREWHLSMWNIETCVPLVARQSDLTRYSWFCIGIAIAQASSYGHAITVLRTVGDSRCVCVCVCVCDECVIHVRVPTCQ